MYGGTSIGNFFIQSTEIDLNVDPVPLSSKYSFLAFLYEKKLTAESCQQTIIKLFYA